MEATVPTSVPSGVEDILDELSKEEGVKEVTLGRQAVSAGSVSQVGGRAGSLNLVFNTLY